MKSHVFQMKYFLAGIYIICVIFTCFNARFYHTPLAKISSVTEKETMSRKGTRDAEEYYYTQKITARILNGTHKGEEISISNEYTSSQVQNQKYHKGDTVLLSGSRENPGKSIRSIKRDGYLALLAGGLFFLLICITGKQGFYTIISLILNAIIFAFGFQAFMKGENILNICNVIAFLFSITTLICLNGIHRKTWASVISTICVLFLIMALFEFSIQFFGDLDYSNLEYLGSMSNSADIFWTDIMLTGLGAIMDVAVTISAATGEIVRKNPDVSLRKLIHSGREIGYDIMGTMINVLLFVLASSMIPMFILKMNNEIRFITIIRYHIPYDIDLSVEGDSYHEILNVIREIFNKIEAKYPNQKKGIFLANDTYANMFLNLIFQKYGTFPSTYEIVGFDNSPIATEAILPITTIGQQIDVIAKTAMDLLVQQMDEQKKRVPKPLGEPVHKQIAPVLIRRNTTK